jgi:hypothetical protein
MPEEIFAVIVTAMVLGVPILGLTIRMVAKPMAEAIAHLRDTFGDKGSNRLSDRRIAALEEEVDGLRKTVQQLAEAEEFRQALQAPRPQVALSPPIDPTSSNPPEHPNPQLPSGSFHPPERSDRGDGPGPPERSDPTGEPGHPEVPDPSRQDA